MEHAFAHMLGHATSSNKFQKTKITQVTFYDHNAIKLENNKNKISRKPPSIQMLSTTLQNQLMGLNINCEKIRKILNSHFINDDIQIMKQPIIGKCAQPYFSGNHMLKVK